MSAHTFVGTRTFTRLGHIAPAFKTNRQVYRQFYFQHSNTYFSATFPDLSSTSQPEPGAAAARGIFFAFDLG